MKVKTSNNTYKIGSKKAEKDNNVLFMEGLLQHTENELTKQRNAVKILMNQKQLCNSILKKLRDKVKK